MKFMQLASLAALASSVAAYPSWMGWQKPGCIKQSQAEDIVAKFISVLQHPNVAAANVTAQALLADDFQEISDSILSLEGQPLGGASFPGKTAYINGVLYAPPVEGIHTIEILTAGCSKILWYWNFTGIGTGKYEIKGFNLFTINNNTQIETVDLEFNSIAWGLNTGYSLVFPTNGSAY